MNYPTPRTDSAHATIISGTGNWKERYMNSISYARQLEQELNHCRETLSSLYVQATGPTSVILPKDCDYTYITSLAKSLRDYQNPTPEELPC